MLERDCAREGEKRKNLHGELNAMKTKVHRKGDTKQKVEKRSTEA